MPMSYQIDEVQGVVLMSASGVLVDNEMISCIDRLRDDPALSPGMATLSDMRAVTQLDITSGGLASMLGRMTRTETHRGIAKAAIVASSDVAFGMARMLSALGEAKEATPHFRAFHDMAEARAWLGLK